TGLPPARPLLSLGLLQIVLGCSLVALNFGALSLSNAPQVKNACPLWAGCSVILSGILGLVAWKRPMVVLANLFVLLSMVCVLLNLAGFILGCQGIQFVSSVRRCYLVDKAENNICFCCKELHLTKCTEETALKLYHMESCVTAHLLFKKILFALCVLNALTTTVCLIAAALHYFQIFATRRSCIDESQIENQGCVLDPDDFVPPALPPSYFATLCSYTPETSCRMLGSGVIPLPRAYGARIKDNGVFCPLDPPPPYEEVVCSQNISEQEDAPQISGVEVVDSREGSDREASQGEEIPESSSRVSLSPSNASPVPEGARRSAFNPLRKRSKSDPLLHSQLFQGGALISEAAMQTDVNPQLCPVTLRKSLRARALRGRPQSLIDYKSYTATKLLAAWILEQSCSMSPDTHELAENTKSVLKSDEKHMAEAITSTTFLEQVVMTFTQQATSSSAHVSPFRRHPRLLHLENCGDLSTFTTDEDQLAEWRVQRARREWPHSLIGIVRETVL
ncbi:F1892 protein, partial [Stercorarius parasiticus]|nr:F1892 protein [Stercorarius parasiticus]